jgi:hypothetical protein
VTQTFLRRASYAHSVVYAVLLYVAFVDRHDALVTVFGWAHGLLWIAMSLLCIAAVRRRVIPLWLAVMVAVVGGVGPFAGSIAFYLEKRTGARQRVALPRHDEGVCSEPPHGSEHHG